MYHAVDLATLESDGLLGLSPHSREIGRSGMQLHLLVSELKKDKAINKSMFSLYLADRSDKSKIQFGGYDQAIVDALIEENKDSN